MSKLICTTKIQKIVAGSYNVVLTIALANGDVKTLERTIQKTDKDWEILSKLDDEYFSASTRKACIDHFTNDFINECEVIDERNNLIEAEEAKCKPPITLYEQLTKYNRDHLDAHFINAVHTEHKEWWNNQDIADRKNPCMLPATKNKTLKKKFLSIALASALALFPAISSAKNETTFNINAKNQISWFEKIPCKNSNMCMGLLATAKVKGKAILRVMSKSAYVRISHKLDCTDVCFSDVEKFIKDNNNNNNTDKVIK